MQPHSRQIFRQEALDRLAAGEALDRSLQVVQPQAWLALSAIGLLAAGVSVWGIWGRIPLTISGQGILIKPYQVVELHSPGEGQLVSLNVRSGDVVRQGQIIGTLDQSTLSQQLQQARAKLTDRQNQQNSSDRLQTQRLSTELTQLQQQRQALQSNLRRERTNSDLHQQTETTLAQKRANLELRKQQGLQLLQTLEEQLNTRRELFRQQIVSRDLVTRAEQESLAAQAEQADVEVQLRDLELEIIQARQSELDRLNRVDALQTQIQALNTQEIKLQEQAFHQTIDRTNAIKTLQHQIEHLERQIAQSEIRSPYSGRILELSSLSGQMVNTGSRLGAIDVAEGTTELVGYLYLSNAEGKQIQPGMSVQVTPSFTQRERDGSIMGTVTEVSSFALTLEEIAATVGNEAIATQLTQNGNALMQVTLRLESDPTTASRYRWSSRNGRSIALTSGTTTSVHVRIGDRAPSSYLLPMLRSWVSEG